MNDGGLLRLRLLAVIRGKAMSRALLSKRREALAGGLVSSGRARPRAFSFSTQPMPSMPCSLSGCCARSANGW